MSDPSILRALEQKAAAAQAELARLRSQESATYSEQRQVNAEIRAIRAKIQDPNTPESQKSALAAQGANLESRYNQLEQQGLALAQQVRQQEAAVSAAERELRDAQQAAASTGAATQPTQSSGQTTVEQQRANAEGADPQSPNVAPQTLAADGTIQTTPPSTVGTNAFQSGEAEDANITAGTNDPLRTAINVQSSPVAAPGGIDAVNTNRAGLGSYDAASDDAGRIGSGATASSVAAPRSASPAAPGDDQFNAVKTQINDYFGGPGKVIIPQANVLDKFASYTYNVSLYIMNPQQYRQMLTTKQRNVAGFQLLMSSGGAPIAGGALTPVDTQESQQAADGNSAAVAQPTLGRNQFFPLDYYLDDIQLKSVISGKATGGAHNVFEMSFKIIEPNGITLLDNLYAATQQYAALQGTTGKQNYAAQMYLMVIRFYGYDADGNFVNIKGQVKNPDGSVGPEAVVEKFIPFVFSEIKFRIANKLTEYECNAVCPQNLINTGQGRGTIPYNVELTATNLKELLTGNLTLKSANQTADTGRAQPASTTAAVAATRSNTNNQLPAVGTSNEIDNTNQNYADTPAGYIGLSNPAVGSTTVVAGNSPTQTTAPPKASAAPKPTMVNGLCDALNRYQSEQVAAGKQALADIYEIQIVDQVLQDARLQPQTVPGSPTNYRSTAMTPQTTAAEQKDGKKQNANSQSKNSDIQAGMSIVKFIDMAVRNSSYIYDQQIKIPTVDPKTGQEKDIPAGGAADVLAWYRIGTEAEPIAYDRLRNDYAYKIKYQISLYQVNGVKSDYFPPSKFPGQHKIYNYWFTGQNNSILSLEQDFNYLYYIVVNSKRNPSSQAATRTSDYREYEKYLVQTRSNQSDQGQPGKINEPGANAADYLYSPADQSRIKLTIVGDPAWLQQGELAFGLSGKSLYQSPFLNDGTINFERQEVLFEVAFNKVVDYDLNTGIMDPGQKNYEANRAAGQAGYARQSYIYKAIEVTSNFNRGRFTQDLEGVMVTFDIKSKDAASTNVASFDSFRGGEAEDADVDAGTRTPPINTTPASIVSRNNPTATGAGVGGQVAFPATTDLSRSLETPTGSFLQVNPVSTLVPQLAPGVPSSAGAIVGPAPNTDITTNEQSGGVTQRPVSTQVVLKSGTVRTVTSEPEINQLYSQGLITGQEAGAAVYRLSGLTAAQQAPVTTSGPQLTDRET